MKKATTGSANIHIGAPPATVYDTVSDVRRMGEWSPECRECAWLDGATGPAVGARFRGTNSKGPCPLVDQADRRRRRAGAGVRVRYRHHKWTYRFGPDDGSTKVTESFEIIADEPLLLDLGQRYLLRIKDRRRDLEAGMQATLTRIKEAVERDQTPPEATA